MAATIAVLGANGVYARHLIPRLVASGHEVRALVRRREAAGVAAACGADIRKADIFDLGSMRAALEGCEIGVNLATTLPGPSGRGDFAANDRLRSEGTPNWVRACREAGVGRVIQQSIALVNSGAGEAWADEDTVYPPENETIAGRAIAAALSMEATVRQSQLDWLILRGGLFYGPGTGFDEDWYSRALMGKLRLPGDGADYVSLAHIADMAAATVAAIARWPSRQALIVADDMPVRWRELFTHITKSVGSNDPEPGGLAGFPSFRVSNARARDALGWRPFHTDYRSGLAR